MPEIPMENSFLIEIRLGRTKWRIKRITEKIVTFFSIPEFSEKHPHITLFGPFSLKEGITVPQLLKAVEEAATPHSSIPFFIRGYDMNQGLNGAVIAYRVVPSDSLIAINTAVSSSVSRLAKTVNVWDTDPRQKWFHVTIANRLDRVKGSGLYAQLTGQMPVSETIAREIRQSPEKGITAFCCDNNGRDNLPPPPVLDEDGIRISVINGENILAEYDLGRRCWFSFGIPGAALEWQRSLQQFRKDRGIELTMPRYSTQTEVFVISDLHLGHANIIQYCSRPFPHNAAGEMDEMLIRNWNFTVKARDSVYHLGDLSYKSERTSSDYLRCLNGSIILIAGNHDAPLGSSPPVQSVIWDGIPFTLVHDPVDLSPVPGGWVIHGHYHNNDLARYPFIDFEQRRINVSAEVIQYRPISLSELGRIIRHSRNGTAEKQILLRTD